MAAWHGKGDVRAQQARRVDEGCWRASGVAQPSVFHEGQGTLELQEAVTERKKMCLGCGLVEWACVDYIREHVFTPSRDSGISQWQYCWQQCLTPAQCFAVHPTAKRERRWQRWRRRTGDVHHAKIQNAFLHAFLRRFIRLSVSTIALPIGQNPEKKTSPCRKPVVHWTAEENNQFVSCRSNALESSNYFQSVLFDVIC